MLRAISNIKLKAGQEHTSNNGYKRMQMHNLIRENDVHDSLDISKGYRILKDYELQIRRFKKNQHGLLEIVFDFDIVEFNTKMNLDNLSTFLITDYLLKYCKTDPKFNLFLHTRTFIDEYVDSVMKIDDIKYLMDRINSLGVSSELNVSNTRALTNLLDGVYGGVMNEFRQINSILTSAVKNIFNLQLKNVSRDDKQNEIIIIEKIIPPNGHD